MYESWFQLSKRPFGAAPQIDDYYPSESMELARKTIVRSIEGSGGPSILVGGAGSGKSTLCLKLQDQYRDATPTGYFSCCGIQTRRELLQQILFAFGRPYDANDEGELRISLTHFVQSQDSRILLLIDDVDDVPDELFEELRSISNLTKDGNWCVNLVLAGKAKLEEQLARPRMESLDQRIASRSYLGKWNSSEVVEYVRFQIARAGGDADTIFNDEALEQIKETTDGLPRLVNQVCDHAMIMAGLGNIEQLDAMHIKEAWADLQQLPSPSQTESEAENTNESESMIEFGMLDADNVANDDVVEQHRANEAAEASEASDNESSDDLPTECEESWNGLNFAETSEAKIVHEGESAVLDFGPDGEEKEEEECDETNFVSLSHDDKAAFDRSLDADRGTPASELDEESLSNAETSHASIRLADSSQGDLVDRLDDIEREVQRVSSELRGGEPAAELLDVTEHGGDEPSSNSNPFLEIFDEEEVVFGTHNTLNNELVRRQPAVFTSGGDALIDVIRMVDQGSEKKKWELLDNVTGSQPADSSLSLELSASPFLMARHEPEIAEANESGADFAESEFTFNYSAPIGASSELEEIHPMTDQPVGEEATSVDDDATDECDHGQCETCEIAEADGETVIVGDITLDETPVSSICGSCVGETDDLDLEIITTGETPLTEELAGDLEITRDASPSDAHPVVVKPYTNDEWCRTEDYEVGHGKFEDADPTTSVGTESNDPGEAGGWGGRPASDAAKPAGTHENDTEEYIAPFPPQEPTEEPEPIEQALILPPGGFATFSNRTQFGAPDNSNVGESTSGSTQWQDRDENSRMASEELATSDQNAKPKTRKPRRKLNKLFSNLKSNRPTGR